MKTKHIHSGKSQNCKVNLKLTTMLCGLALLVPQLVLAADSDKVVKICNNYSTKPLWVTISSTPVGGSENYWLKGRKIDRSECFSQKIELQNWNAGRAYIFDREPKSNEYNSDGNFQLVEFTFRGPGGTGGTAGDGIGYNFSAVDSFSGLIPLAVEATDSNETPNAWPGYTGNKLTSETNQDPAAFEPAMNKLIDAGWPYYVNASHDGQYKIPGGYNVFALYDPDKSEQDRINNIATYKDSNKMITAKTLTDKWLKWVSGGYTCNNGDKFCTDFQAAVRKVWAGFKENAAVHGLKDDGSDKYNFKIAKHITGYVNFNDEGPSSDPNNPWKGIDNCLRGKEIIPNCTDRVGPAWIALAQGIPAETPEYNKKKFPDYGSRYNLDPYVTAIHRDFNMNVYAFSIDDNVGYFDVVKSAVNPRDFNKLIIAVGGYKNLPNQKQDDTQKDPPSSFHVSFAQSWDSIESCGYKKPDLNKQPGTAPVVFDETKTCTVTMKSNYLSVNHWLRLTLSKVDDKNMTKDKCETGTGEVGDNSVPCSPNVISLAVPVNLPQQGTDIVVPLPGQ